MGQYWALLVRSGRAGAESVSVGFPDSVHVPLKGVPLSSLLWGLRMCDKDT